MVDDASCFETTYLEGSVNCLGKGIHEVDQTAITNVGRLCHYDAHRVFRFSDQRLPRSDKHFFPAGSEIAKKGHSSVNTSLVLEHDFVVFSYLEGWRL